MPDDNWKLAPADIEARSFAMIDEEAGPRDNWSDEDWRLVRRLIHTSADFDYMRDLVVSPGAVRAGVAALREGAIVLTDTHMALSGINLRRLGSFGNPMACLVDDVRAVSMAGDSGVTRSMAAVDLAFSSVINRGEGAVWVFGNAPTGLLRLLERLGSDPSLPVPRLVVGLPVGFVNAFESKKALSESGLPYFITNLSRKGGSNVAAAAVNALAAMAREADRPGRAPETPTP
ncbi:MAG: precorrin-8X methylmutase [Deltaproteobacteria bacterium]|jgi:precorrin-8X/cobalt-precorrin-8 methylmutase|nr:precorrin-8X methylmutase [Deltaproteobacteria bacterium]